MDEFSKQLKKKFKRRCISNILCVYFNPISLISKHSHVYPNNLYFGCHIWGNWLENFMCEFTKWLCYCPMGNNRKHINIQMITSLETLLVIYSTWFPQPIKCYFQDKITIFHDKISKIYLKVMNQNMNKKHIIFIQYMIDHWHFYGTTSSCLLAVWSTHFYLNFN